jgi:hypothetical protein
MQQNLAYLATAGLVLMAGSGAAHSTNRISDAVTHVEVLVNGAPQRRYLHEGRWYIEALKGREYAIRLRNPYAVRVAVALSVDGLNTIDARHTAASDARKWVLDPYETVTISGWQTSRSQARRFEFTTESQSYAHALGRPANIGVISAVFFRERVTALAAEPLRRHSSPEAGGAAQEPAPPAASSVPSAPSARAGNTRQRASMDEAVVKDQEYAATGMGRATNHAVTQVWLDLDDSPAFTVNMRYEFRPQLVKLGILPSPLSVDPLQRRERAHGFEPGFSPEPPRHR